MSCASDNSTASFFSRHLAIARVALSMDWSTHSSMDASWMVVCSASSE